MISKKQVLANKENSKKSTGPKNIEKTRFNAVKFGIFSKEMVLDGFYGIENKNEFAELVDDVNVEYSPQTITEKILADKIIDCAWRLKRIRIAETVMIKKGIYEIEEKVREEILIKDVENYLLTTETKIITTFDFIPEPFLVKNIKELKKTISNETDEDEVEKLKDSLKYFTQLWKNKEDQISSLVLLKEKGALVPDEVEKLLSYETTIERQLYRAIVALRRLKGWD